MFKKDRTINMNTDRGRKTRGVITKKNPKNLEMLLVKLTSFKQNKHNVLKCTMCLRKRNTLKSVQTFKLG